MCKMLFLMFLCASWSSYCSNCHKMSCNGVKVIKLCSSNSTNFEEPSLMMSTTLHGSFLLGRVEKTISISFLQCFFQLYTNRSLNAWDSSTKKPWEIMVWKCNFSLENVHQEHFVANQLQDKAILCAKCYFWCFCVQADHLTTAVAIKWLVTASKW